MKNCDSISKSNIIGWILTISMSIIGAYYTIDSRVYEVEKKIEIVQLQVDNTKELLAQNQNDVKDIKALFIKIDKAITEMNGNLQLKEDKKWR